MHVHPSVPCKCHRITVSHADRVWHRAPGCASKRWRLGRPPSWAHTLGCLLVFGSHSNPRSVRVPLWIGRTSHQLVPASAAASHLPRRRQSKEPLHAGASFFVSFFACVLYAAEGQGELQNHLPQVREAASCGRHRLESEEVPQPNGTGPSPSSQSRTGRCSARTRSGWDRLSCSFLGPEDKAEGTQPFQRPLRGSPRSSAQAVSGMRGTLSTAGSPVRPGGG